MNHILPSSKFRCGGAYVSLMIISQSDKGSGRLMRHYWPSMCGLQVLKLAGEPHSYQPLFNPPGTFFPFLSTLLLRTSS
jgi:hypothetical protein